MLAWFSAFIVAPSRMGMTAKLDGDLKTYMEAFFASSDPKKLDFYYPPGNRTFRTHEELDDFCWDLVSRRSPSLVVAPLC